MEQTKKKRTFVEKVILRPRGTDLGDPMHPITTVENDKHLIRNGIRNCRYFVELPGRNEDELKVYLEITTSQWNISDEKIRRYEEAYAKLEQVEGSFRRFVCNQPMIWIECAVDHKDGLCRSDCKNGQPWLQDNNPSIKKIAEQLHKHGYDFNEIVVLPM